MILVTGAAGMSGTEIIKEFSSQGLPVRALSGTFPGRRRLLWTEWKSSRATCRSRRR
jgi:nucleoside-diphosphate-sugar epimerase